MGYALCSLGRDVLFPNFKFGNNINGFPKGKVYLASEQSERIKIVESVLADENIVLGIGDRWDDNQLHLMLGCKSVIVKEYQGDFEFVKKYIE